jgi:hypothetical protein
MSTSGSHFEQLLTEMGSLRPLLEGRADAREFLAVFDDFVEHQEFGLALHAICDYFQEQDVPLDPVAIDRIAQLHALMELTDDCPEPKKDHLDTLMIDRIERRTPD